MQLDLPTKTPWSVFIQENIVQQKSQIVSINKHTWALISTFFPTKRPWAIYWAGADAGNTGKTNSQHNMSGTRGLAKVNGTPKISEILKKFAWYLYL